MVAPVDPNSLLSLWSDGVAMSTRDIVELKRIVDSVQYPPEGLISIAALSWDVCTLSRRGKYDRARIVQ